MKQNSEIDCAYGLKLADGSLWKLTGTKAVSGWLAELAHIVGCGPFSQTPTHTIHFHGVKDLSIPPHAKPCFIETGVNEWTPFKNGGIQRVWRHAHRPEIHVELHEAFLDHEEIRYINMWSALRELHRHALSNGGTPSACGRGGPGWKRGLDCRHRRHGKVHLLFTTPEPLEQDL